MVGSKLNANLNAKAWGGTEPVSAKAERWGCTQSYMPRNAKHSGLSQQLPPKTWQGASQSYSQTPVPRNAKHSGINQQLPPKPGKTQVQVVPNSYAPECEALRDQLEHPEGMFVIHLHRIQSQPTHNLHTIRNHRIIKIKPWRVHTRNRLIARTQPNEIKRRRNVQPIKTKVLAAHHRRR